MSADFRWTDRTASTYESRIAEIQARQTQREAETADHGAVVGAAAKMVAEEPNVLLKLTLGAPFLLLAAATDVIGTLEKRQADAHDDAEILRLGEQQLRAAQRGE